MSETVKLIIEIPKETYLEIKSGFITRNAIASAEAIKNGIPLDDVFDKISAEIKELRDSWEKDCYHDEAEALNIALKIIDKHIGKGDSKDDV